MTAHSCHGRHVKVCCLWTHPPLNSRAGRPPSSEASSLEELRVCSSRLLLRASIAAMSSRMCRSFMSSVDSASWGDNSHFQDKTPKRHPDNVLPHVLQHHVQHGQRLLEHSIQNLGFKP
jgi:hypothetical protein